MRDYEEEIEKLSREITELTLEKEDKVAQLQSVIQEKEKNNAKKREKNTD